MKGHPLAIFRHVLKSRDQREVPPDFYRSGSDADARTTLRGDCARPQGRGRKRLDRSLIAWPQPADVAALPN